MGILKVFKGKGLFDVINGIFGVFKTIKTVKRTVKVKKITARVFSDNARSIDYPAMLSQDNQVVYIPILGAAHL